MVLSSAMAYVNRTRTDHYELDGQDIVMTIEYDEEDIPVRSIVESDTYKVIAEKSPDGIDLTYIDKQNNEVQTKTLDVEEPEQGQSNECNLPSQNPDLYALTDSYTSKYFPDDWYKMYNDYDWLVCYGGDDVAAYVRDDHELENLCEFFTDNLKTTDDFLDDTGDYVKGGLPIIGDGYTIVTLLENIATGNIEAHEIILAISGLLPHLGKITNATMFIASLTTAGVAHHNYKTAFEDIVEIIRG